MSPRVHSPVPWQTAALRWLTLLALTALLVLQVALFAPLVTQGRSLELSPAGAHVFRVDGLALVFGIAWCVAAALLCLAWHRTIAGRPALLALTVMSLGLLTVSYSGESWVLYVGWEVAGLGLWLAFRFGSASHRQQRQLALVLTASGLPLLLLVLLGVLGPLVPPAGGAASEWHWSVSLAVAAVVGIRGGIWPLGRWVQSASGAVDGSLSPVVLLYSALAPLVLSKLLVAAPWEPVGTWLIVLLAAVGLIGSSVDAWHTFGSAQPGPLAGSLTAATLAGAGLAPGSPIAAAGAVLVLIPTLVWAATSSITGQNPALLLVAILPGVWMITQGALALNYGLVGVVLPLALVLTAAALWKRRRGARNPAPVVGIAGAVLLLISGAYPQGLLALAGRPAVQAMAGGVRALTSVGTDWGVGLQVSSPAEGLLAALPATGLAAEVYVCWVLLYWLQSLTKPRTSNPPTGDEA